MNKIFFATMTFLLLPLNVFANRNGDQGIGVMVGNPSGFSYKMWLGNEVAFDLAAGVAQGEFDIHGSLLWHHFSWSRNAKEGPIRDIAAKGDFPFYLGFGPRVLFEDNTEVGIRFPLGLAYLPHNSVWEFFGEFAPVLRLTPDGGVDGDFAIGVRYYFPAVRPRSEN